MKIIRLVSVVTLFMWSFVSAGWMNIDTFSLGWYVLPWEAIQTIVPLGSGVKVDHIKDLVTHNNLSSLKLSSPDRINTRSIHKVISRVKKGENLPTLETVQSSELDTASDLYHALFEQRSKLYQYHDSKTGGTYLHRQDIYFIFLKDPETQDIKLFIHSKPQIITCSCCCGMGCVIAAGAAAVLALCYTCAQLIT